jgi:hypothetical protein
VPGDWVRFRTTGLPGIAGLNPERARDCLPGYGCDNLHLLGRAVSRPLQSSADAPGYLG